MHFYVRFSDESIAQHLNGEELFADAPESIDLSDEIEQVFSFYNDNMYDEDYSENDEIDDADTAIRFIKKHDPDAFAAYASAMDHSTGMTYIMWSAGSESEVHALDTDNYIHNSPDDENDYEHIPVFGTDEWFDYAVRLERERQEYIDSLED